MVLRVLCVSQKLGAKLRYSYNLKYFAEYSSLPISVHFKESRMKTFEKSIVEQCEAIEGC